MKKFKKLSEQPLWCRIIYYFLDYFVIPMLIGLTTLIILVYWPIDKVLEILKLEKIWEYIRIKIFKKKRVPYFNRNGRFDRPKKRRTK